MNSYSALVYKEKRRPLGRSYWKCYRLSMDETGLIILASINGDRTKAASNVLDAVNSMRLCKSKDTFVIRKGELTSVAKFGYVLVISLMSKRRPRWVEEMKLGFECQSQLFVWLRNVVQLVKRRKGSAWSEKSTDTDCGENINLNALFSTKINIGNDHDPFWPMHLVSWPSIWQHFQSCDLDYERRLSVLSVDATVKNRSNSEPVVRGFRDF